MDRKEFLQKAVLTAGVAVTGLQRLRAANKPQKFNVGMAATLWLQADAATETIGRPAKLSPVSALVDVA